MRVWKLIIDENRIVQKIKTFHQMWLSHNLKILTFPPLFMSSFSAYCKFFRIFIIIIVSYLYKKPHKPIHTILCCTLKTGSTYRNKKLLIKVNKASCGGISIRVLCQRNSWKTPVISSLSIGILFFCPK